MRRQELAGCFLYGPYLHLPQGQYRLTFRCRCGAPLLSAQPVLGIEIIVLARFQQQWRDFTALELASGSGSLDFEVAPEHSLESENEGRFEFRFFHLGNADLEVTAVTLDRLAEGGAGRGAERVAPAGAAAEKLARTARRRRHRQGMAPRAQWVRPLRRMALSAAAGRDLPALH